MFCSCGALIFFPTLVSEDIVCQRCTRKIQNPEFVKISISKEFSHKTDENPINVVGAKINIPCPKCSAPEMSYNTAQLRSADEGQTVFYTCDLCGYKETVQS